MPSNWELNGFGIPIYTGIAPRNEVVVCVDLTQRRLGGANSWGEYPHEPYLLKQKEYSYGFVIKTNRKAKK